MQPGTTACPVHLAGLEGQFRRRAALQQLCDPSALAAASQPSALVMVEQLAHVPLSLQYLLAMQSDAVEHFAAATWSCLHISKYRAKDAISSRPRSIPHFGCGSAAPNTSRVAGLYLAGFYAAASELRARR